MDKPNLSKDFTVEDIRKLREYNNERRKNMTPEELSEDIKAGAAEGLRLLGHDKEEKQLAIK